MLLTELKAEDAKNGTYVGLKMDPDSKEALKAFQKSIPNPLSSSEFHTTLIYSRKPFTFESRGKLDEPIVAKPKKFSIFDTQTGARCLVIELESKEIEERHRYIMDKYKATYDYPEYKPHVTLSYDIGDFDISKLKIEDVPEVKFVSEYDQPIDLEWEKKAKTD